MDEKQASELIVSYENLILEFSRKMLWLIKQKHGQRYQFAVHTDIHNRTIARLEQIHLKLLEYSDYKPL